jgi:hypothetical protein
MAGELSSRVRALLDRMDRAVLTHEQFTKELKAFTPTELRELGDELMRRIRGESALGAAN